MFLRRCVGRISSSNDLLSGSSCSRCFGWSLLVLGDGFLLVAGLKEVMTPPMVFVSSKIYRFGFVAGGLGCDFPS
jgi:hypothetical protein